MDCKRLRSYCSLRTAPNKFAGRHVDVLELLLAHGADVNAKTEKRRTCTHMIMNSCRKIAETETKLRYYRT